jgi:hypothetical protein
MADPIDQNDTSGCTEKMDADCIPWNGPNFDCMNICAGDSLKDVVTKEGNLLCQIVNDLNTLENPPTPPVVDFSSLDLKCLYSATITTYVCPCPGLMGQPQQYFYPGIGYCGSDPAGPSPVLTTCVPVPNTVPNPTPRPNTLLGILQLILSKIPCCDPCATLPRLCCEAPYIWVSPAATGNPALYPNGGCSQTGTASAINPAVLPFKC